MKRLNVAAAALNQTPLDWDGNRDRIIEAVDRARDRGVRLLCLPEMCITGYGCEDMFNAESVRQTAAAMLQEIAPATAGIAVAVGLPVAHDGALFNTSCLLANGCIHGFVAKQHLPGVNMYYEPRWFQPWPACKQAMVTLDGIQYPFGDLVFNVNGVRIGFEICEDAWVADRPGNQCVRRGVDVILNPSASHFAFGKTALRESFVLGGSREFGAVYVYSNLLGNEAGRMIYDGHAMIAAEGSMVALGRRFGFQPVTLAVASVDLDHVRQARPALDDVDTTFEVAVDVTLLADDAAVDPDTPDAESWEQSEHTKCEEFTRAITLALHDYMRKSHSYGFVVSLSGGADSSAVVALIATMVDLGCQELGLRAYAELVGHADSTSTEALLGSLLTTLYQSTQNSSDRTRNAARVLAEGVGTHHLELDVDDLVNGYVQRIESALGTTLNWNDHDLALQNIQARVRAPGAWLLANLGNKLLLSTSNRSEAAVGYATMDGDTSGGLSPIAGIDKAFLLEWLHWMEVTGPSGVGPITALKTVNQLEPTAELRPSDRQQTDEADLMPYPILEAIEEAAIGRKLDPQQVFIELRPRLEDVDAEQLREWVIRFFRLWARNQWKRERYAPAFHVDDRNLDPKTWCRFPILSGGFERELRDLEAMTISE